MDAGKRKQIKPVIYVRKIKIKETAVYIYRSILFC